MAGGGRSKKAATRRGVWHAKFFDVLAKTGNARAAAHAVGVNRQTVYNHKSKSRSFAKKWEEAIAESVELVEHELWRRVIHGETRKKFTKNGKPVMDRDTGKQYVEVQKSDALIMFFLKARRPEVYRESYRRDEATEGNADKVIRVRRINAPKPPDANPDPS